MSHGPKYCTHVHANLDTTNAVSTCLKLFLLLQGPTAAEMEVQALKEDVQAMKERLSDGARQLRFQHK